jgi:hypothetical protein
MYVGITCRTVDSRWKAHVSAARRGDGWKLAKAIRKYGPDQFDVVELFSYQTKEEAGKAEIALIAALGLTSKGYNVLAGGGLMSDEGRRRLSTNSRPPRTFEHDEAVGKSLRGRKRPAKVGIHISLGHYRRRLAKERGLTTFDLM